MERKKLKPQVKVVLVILGIILFFILLENGINALGEYAENRKYQKEYEQKQEAYEKTPEYHEEQYVAGCVEQTVDLINVYDYEELYRWRLKRLKIRLCHIIWLIFDGKILRNTVFFARLQIFAF